MVKKGQSKITSGGGDREDSKRGKRKKSSVTRYSTLEKFIKDRTKQRVSKEAIEFLLTQTDKIYDRLVKDATKYSKKDDRTTILDRDFEKALKGSFSGEGELNPQLVYKQIDTLSVDNLAKLIKIVKEALKD